MSGEEAPRTGDGSSTATGGTPLAVDVSMGRQARVTIAAFLGGPVVWSAHFMLVYAVAEAGCTGEGTGLDAFDPPVPTVVTLAATAVAALACLALAAWSHRRWRAGQRRADDGERAGDLEDPGGSLSFAGFLLALLSFVSVLFVGLPALYLPAC